jgi:GGDEF domain-containing protein
VDTGAPGDIYGKRALVELSRTIERFAMGAPAGEPLVVMAMFQKHSYFEPAGTTYGHIASRGAVTVVGIAEDTPPAMPAGVHVALLAPSDVLAREWSVTVLGPLGGATLVTTDLETIDPVARSLEDGRTFRGAWSVRRQDAVDQVLRLRSALQLPVPVRDEVDRVLKAVQATAEPAQESWWSTPLQHLVSRVATLDRRHAAAVMELDALRDDGSDRDPRTGLYTERFLDRWTRGLGAGTLPIGLALVRVFGIVEVRSRYGLRAELAALRGVSACVQNLLTPADRVVRLGREDFLVVLPSWEPERVLWFCEEVCTRMAALDQTYPFVSLPGIAAATVTRSRPLPVDELRRQIELSGGSSGPVSVLPD